MKKKPLNLRDLASKLAKIEGKKSQVKIGDIREILAILSDLWVKDGDQISALFIRNGHRRLGPIQKSKASKRPRKVKPK